MNTRRIFLALLMALALQACGGGDDGSSATEPAAAEMPCKYRPDCTPGPPVGSTPEPPASAASA